jgi:CDP-glucose 4,6-dehydratase
MMDTAMSDNIFNLDTNYFNKFYRGKIVFITGHTGFKGSWLTLWLLKLGAKIVGYSLYLPSEPCNYNILGLDKYITNIEEDVRNFEQLSYAIDKCKPNIIFHLAAQPIVKRSYEDPKLTFDTNVGGTINILECLKKTDSIQAAVIITSDKCYKNEEWVWGYREDDRLGGNDPYSASKACAEVVINSYCQSFLSKEKYLRIASARAGNVIGGGDWSEDRLVPDCIKSWSEGRKVIVRNQHATRPWQHVLEPLSGYLWLGVLLGQKQLASGEAFNFGPQTDVIQPVGVLVNQFASYWDNATWMVGGTDSNKKENTLLKLCCDKALHLLNWQAILSFNETIESTALWYKKYYENNSGMLEFTINQIDKYASLAKKKGLEWTKTV